MACGERVLLPKVREASPDTLIVSDGFSCRSQIEQGDTGRRGMHVAEVMKLARDRGAIPAYPERAVAEPKPPSRKLKRAALVVGAAAFLAGAAVAGSRR